MLLRRPLRVVIHAIGEVGTDEASARATWFRDHFRPAVILLMGIAAGRREKIKIGSVVVSRAIVDHTRQVAVDGEMLPRISAPPLAFVMKQMLAAYRIDKREFESLAQRLFGRQLVSPSGREAEFKDYVAKVPTVTDGEIASANSLLRDPEVLEELSRDVHQGIKMGIWSRPGWSGHAITAKHQFLGSSFAGCRILATILSRAKFTNGPHARPLPTPSYSWKEDLICAYFGTKGQTLALKNSNDSLPSA